MRNIKDYRKDELRAYVIGNVLVALLLYGVITPETIKGGAICTLINTAIVSSVIYVYAFILDTVVPAVWKDGLVYAITGKPGNTIFSDIRRKDIDDRFTSKEALEKYADVYQKIDEASSDKERHKIENDSWYSIYGKYEEKSSVFYEFYNAGYNGCLSCVLCGTWRGRPPKELFDVSSFRIHGYQSCRQGESQEICTECYCRGYSSK